MKWTLLISALVFSFSAQAMQVDAAKTEFKWTGKKVTGEHYGKIPLKSSKLDVKDGKVVGGEFVIDITQMTCDDLTGEYQTKFLTHMKSEDFFDVAKWPTAKLVITKIEGDKAIGNLTIKDKTNPVTIPFKKEGDTYAGTLTFDRTKFGMIYGSGDFFKNLGDKMIYNDVTLNFKVAVTGGKKKAMAASK